MKSFIENLLKISGFRELNPVQKEAIKKGLLENKNFIIASPTASGKTFAAELAMIKTILEERKKVVYIVPLVALAAEKYNNFRKKYEGIRIKVALSIGDFDNSDPWLKEYDIIVCSNEKLDSLIRHGAEWINDVGLVVCDEIHLINDESRGPTLEILITKLREISNARIIALSATIKNIEDLAKWLNANYIASDWRPVKLYEGVFFEGILEFHDWKKYKLDEDSAEKAIVKNTLEMNKQCIIFVGTRKASEKLAKELKNVVEKFLKEEEKEELKRISDEILNVLEYPSEQCKLLAECVKSGIAFHHAGLLGKQKFIIEEAFRKRLIKVIAATPTLAMGVSLPAFRVIIRDVKRYYPRLGYSYIPISEYKQMSGRAGRPEYDEWGESILVARNFSEARKLYEHYILGESEEIYSKLFLEPILRIQTLSLIASGNYPTIEDIRRFFSKTFFASQYGDIERIIEKIERIIDLLIKWKFVKEKGKIFEATRLGERVDKLYIDPFTAWHFISNLMRKRHEKLKDIAYLLLISRALEMMPLPNVKSKEFDELLKIAEKELFFEKVPDAWDDEFDDFIRSLKLAIIFKNWIEEKPEAKILEEFGITPGELMARLEIADWLLYSAYELSKILHLKIHKKIIKKLMIRMKYGIKEELLPLISIKGIGRVRARKLYNSGIKNIEDIRKIPLNILENIIGKKLAKEIKEEVENS